MSEYRRLGHYHIVERIGAGGMGEVYRATDSKLGRDVALKVLPTDMASDPLRLERFRREAKALAALDHPGIVHIYSVEESEGVHFLTMQLVEGQPLDRLIPESGLPVRRILEIATSLAEALVVAHDRGIIHRDLKPANIMITAEGHVKVLDFGLAKILDSGEAAEGNSELPTEMHTRAGIVMGTVPYMSPEQISGRTVDQRSDIFSLGVILYEMATGEQPFRGRSSAELASAILRDTPTPPGELRNDLPAGLAQVIGRCLEKDPRARFATAQDLRDGLTGTSIAEPSDKDVIMTTSRPPARVQTAPTPADEGFWVAVLPFKWRGAITDLEALAEGLSEDIVTGLSRFSYLRVISRSSTLPYASDSGDVRKIGIELGAHYVMEGSLRQAGSMLRVAVQLVDASTGAHLWAETYNRTFSPEDIFELQDDLVPRIVSTVADMHGVLPRRMSETVRLKATDQLTPYEALLHSFGYNERFTPEALAEARTCLERAVEQAPGNADCWAMLSLMYSNEYGHWDIRNPDSFENALQAARKAVLVAPLHSLSHYALAQALFFRREFPASRTAAERAVSLNPMDGATAAFMGLLIAYSGDWERGCALAEKGFQLNPNLPGMYNYTAWHDAYRKKDYRSALNIALKLNTPDNYYQHAVLTMCYAQLGELDAAHKSLQDMLSLKPDYGKVARRLHGKWISPDLVEQLMDGLRKAGLEIADEEEYADAWTARPASGGRRVTPEETGSAQVTSSAEYPASTIGRHKRSLAVPLAVLLAAVVVAGYWFFSLRHSSPPIDSLAVLPFHNRSPHMDSEYLSDGLAESLIYRLSQIPNLKVSPTSSVFRFKGKDNDPIQVGRELGVQAVMTGHIAERGENLVISVELVDVRRNKTLWGEKYDRKPADLLAIQREMASEITQRLQLELSGEAEEKIEKTYTDNTEAFQLYLKGQYHFSRRTKQDEQKSVAFFQQAIQLDPKFALAYAGIAESYATRPLYPYLSPKEALPNAKTAVAKALELDPELAEAHTIAGYIASSYDWNWAEAESEFKRAIALNQNLANAHYRYAWTYLTPLGRHEEAIAEMKRAMELEPLNLIQGAHFAAVYMYARQFDAALEQARKTYDLDPTFVIGKSWLCFALNAKGMYEESLAILEKTLQTDSLFFPQMSYAYAKMGRRQQAEEYITRWREAEKSDYVLNYWIAVAYASLGEKDAAFAELEKAYQARDFFFHRFKVDPYLDPLRDDPRYQKMLKRLNLPE